ncbi:MAG: alpha/beta fold hydrolase [Dermatophilaceae bacterium]
MSLATLSLGHGGPRIAFLHGLFGQGRNWAQIAKGVCGEDGTGARALLVDLPDHGRSPWTPSGAAFSFEAYAAAVADTLAEAAPGEPWVLVGHSLGGKTAMVTTLQHPELIAALCVVDIAPKSYGDLHRFTGYIDGMRRMPLGELDSRGAADDWYAEHVEPDPGVRAFLLQNLRRDGQSWRWQANVELFAGDAAKGSGSVIADWPATAVASAPAYEGPVVWLRGEESGYITDEDADVMRGYFPRARQVTVKGAGHWVHTEAPGVVVETLRRLLRTH